MISEKIKKVANFGPKLPKAGCKVPRRNMLKDWYKYKNSKWLNYSKVCGRTYIKCT